MSDDRTPIPVLRQATKDMIQTAHNELEFVPNDLQSRVKARFYRRIEEMSHQVDKETVFASRDLVVQMAGTDRILAWLEKPDFAAWFVDAEYMVDTIRSLQQSAVKVVADVLKSDDATEGDRLKAARMLLELGDQFPGKKSEYRFIDDRIEGMSEADTTKELAEMKAKLTKANPEDVLETSDDSIMGADGSHLGDADGQD
jgi:hypothetical protein